MDRLQKTKESKRKNKGLYVSIIKNRNTLHLINKADRILCFTRVICEGD